MAKEFGRSARVSSQMQKELAIILQREIDDPRLGFITINEVLLEQGPGLRQNLFYCVEHG